MSILLDALRKSEKSQRPVEAPTIYAEQEPGGGSETLRKGPIAIMILLTMILIGWIVWNQYQVPEGSYQPPVSLPSKPEAALATPPVSPENTDPGVAAGNDSKPPLKQARTPVENYQDAIRNMVKSKAEKPTADEPVTAAAQAANNPNTAAQTPLANIASKPEPTQTPVTDTAMASKQPAPISYWEIPDALRANIPVIRFSVLVYATQPADRFVLINGERLHEGDSFRPGLVVEEIRRDGVIFSYRLYRFLVER